MADELRHGADMICMMVRNNDGQQFEFFGGPKVNYRRCVTGIHHNGIAVVAKCPDSVVSEDAQGDHAYWRIKTPSGDLR